MGKCQSGSLCNAAASAPPCQPPNLTAPTHRVACQLRQVGHVPLVAHAAAIAAPASGRAAVAAISHYHVIAQSINHEPHDAIIGGRRRLCAGLRSRRGTVGQVHAGEQEACKQRCEQERVPELQVRGWLCSSVAAAADGAGRRWRWRSCPQLIPALRSAVKQPLASLTVHKQGQGQQVQQQERRRAPAAHDILKSHHGKSICAIVTLPVSGGTIG